ncbi:hypothetical protein [Aliarcobacter cryaerophilus]|uniref:hypothetical protein n=1 Tax=Aliarcobacter cryaerophilus TaxID=28198 RepID=UPI0011DFD048|nr:hypothetical protein [Aliarcobacter cryaerophilus]
MIDDIKNNFKARMDMNNFFIGILFIFLFLSMLYILNFDFNKNEIFISLSNIFEKFFNQISILESIILVFIINIIGYLINFILKSMYYTHIGFKKHISEIQQKINTIYFHKKLRITDLESNSTFYTPSQKIRAKALLSNKSLLDIKTNENLKNNMATLYLTLDIKSKNESSYQQLIHNINKLRFYQNVISLIYFFFFYTLFLKLITIYSETPDSILFLAFIAFFILILFSTHIAYKHFQEEIDAELLVFIEITNDKFEK